MGNSSINIEDRSLSSRRAFLSSAGVATLSAATMGVLAGCQSMAASKGPVTTNAEQDVSILNVALGLEHEAIGAYQIGAESGLLEKSVLQTAVLFQGHHKEHAAVLISTVETLGGTPVESKPISDYAQA